MKRVGKGKSPAFQWYPKDFYTDQAVVNMSLEAEAVYRRLIDICWLEDGLSLDPESLWRPAKCKSLDHFNRLWMQMRSKFLVRDGKMFHPRLDLERRKQKKNRRVRQLAANRRWELERCKRNANAVQKDCLAFSVSVATPVSVQNPPTPLKGGRRLTRRERQEAELILRRNFGGCPHEPKCSSTDECVTQIGLSRRSKVSA